MPSYNLLNVVCYVYPSNVECSVLPHKTTNSAHVISVITVLVPAKAVHIWVEDIMDGGQSVEVLASTAFWTDPPCEEQTEVGTRNFVGTSISAVCRDVASIWSVSLREVGIFAVTTRPFIILQKSVLSILSTWIPNDLPIC